MDLKSYIQIKGQKKVYCACTQCGSFAMRPEDDCYFCMDCGSVEINPKEVEIREPVIAESIPSEAWISFYDYNALLYISKIQHN